MTGEGLCVFASIVFGIFAVKSRTSLQRHRPLPVRSETPSTLMGAGRGQVEVDLSALICQAFTHCLLGVNRGIAAVSLKSALSQMHIDGHLSPLCCPNKRESLQELIYCCLGGSPSQAK